MEILTHHFKNRLKYCSGSTFIEAALVFPIIIFIVIGLITLAVNMHDRVYQKTGTFISETEEELINTNMTTEDYMRAKWLVDREN